MKCIILAAGYATRLYPLTENFPKPLLFVKHKPIIDWLIDDIEKSKEIDKYIVVSNHKFINQFRTWYNSKPVSLRAKISILDDGTTSNEERRGAVADIKFAIDSFKIDDDVMVIAGDNLLDFSLQYFIRYFKYKGATCIMRYYEENMEKIKKSACVCVNKNERVTLMIEKPDSPASNWCVPPFYIYAKMDVRRIGEAINCGCNVDAPGSLISWLYGKTTIYSMEMPGSRYDVGTVESYNYISHNYEGIKR